MRGNEDLQELLKLLHREVNDRKRAEEENIRLKDNEKEHLQKIAYHAIESKH